MNKEYLRGLGLSEAHVEAVHARHLESTEKFRKLKQQYTDQLEEVKQQIVLVEQEQQQLLNDRPELEHSTEYYQAGIKRLKLESGLIQANAKDKYKSVLSSMLTDVSEEDVPNEIERLKVVNPELFNESSQVYPKSFTLLEQNETADDDARKKIFSIKDKRERQEAIARNLNLF